MVSSISIPEFASVFEHSMVLVFETIHLLSFGMFDALDLVHFKGGVLVVPVEILIGLVVSVDFMGGFFFGSRVWFGKKFVVWCSSEIDHRPLVLQRTAEFGAGQFLQFEILDVSQDRRLDGFKELDLSQGRKLLNFFHKLRVLFVKRGVVILSVLIINCRKWPIMMGLYTRMSLE